jgi:hypothetical protein
MSSLPIPEINIQVLEQFSLENYKECPKYVTIVRHASLEDDSEFHCVRCIPLIGPVIPGSSLSKRNFIVPGQVVLMVTDKIFGLFCIIKVLDVDGASVFWLVSSAKSSVGFIIPLGALPKELLSNKVMIF